MYKIYKIACLFPGGRTGVYDYYCNEELKVGNMVITDRAVGYCEGLVKTVDDLRTPAFTYKQCKRLNKDTRATIWKMLN